MKEAGMDDFEVSAWFGVWAPAKTPPEIIQKMHADTVAVLSEAPIRAKLEQQTLFPIGSTPGAGASRP